MKRLAALLLSFVLVGALLPFPTSVAAADEPRFDTSTLTEGTYREHEALACVVEDERVRLFASGSSLVDDAEPLMSLSEEAMVEAAGQDAAAQLPALQTFSATQEEPVGTLVLVHDESKSVAEILAALEEDNRVLFAEPNYLIEESDNDTEVQGETLRDNLAEAFTEARADTDLLWDAEPDKAAPAEPTVFAASTIGTATDLSSFQWGFDNEGILAEAGSAGVDINYADWNKSTGSGSSDPVVVAVIDSGVNGADAADGSYTANPDLKDKMWSRGSIPELQSIGDEHGFSAQEGGLSTDATKNGHGTHCAGVIAAAWDSTGVSGVSQDALIMSAQHNNTAAGMVKCFNYLATARKAGVNLRVASCSWGLGAGQSRVIDAVVTEVGQLGVVSVFATGNSSYNCDKAGSTVSTLRDNPYAVAINAIGPSGSRTSFSNYGQATTHLMAPGSTILSTWLTSDPQYHAEADEDAVIYESFDSKSHYAAELQRSEIVFPDAVEGSRQFDGDGSIAFNYDPGENGEAAFAKSAPIDLSSLPEKPRYLSIRFSGDLASGGDCMTYADLLVKTTDGYSTPICGSFDAWSDGWGGFYLELPETTDWDEFQIGFFYIMNSCESTTESGAPAAGTVVVDSIGLGSTLVPYTYLAGTSMAAPAVSGIAAVLAQQYGDESADKLAARIKGSAQSEIQGAASPGATAATQYGYADLCLTGGLAGVEGAADPAPSLTEVVDDNSTVSISGYFFGDDPSVTLSGVATPVQSATTDAAGKTTLVVNKPKGFAGGPTDVAVSTNGRAGRLFTTLGIKQTAVHYDQTNLPLFEEIQEWGLWHLVGFDGSLYCLPQFSSSENIALDHFMRFNPKNDTWSEVALPEEIKDIACSMSATTWQGKLAFQITDNDLVASYWLYSADGLWEKIPTAMQWEEDLPLGTLASDGNNLYVFGGYRDEDRSDIAVLDQSAGVLRQVGSLDTGLNVGRIHPNVTYSDGAFLVSGGIMVSGQWATARGVERVSIDNEGKATSEVVDFSSLVADSGQLSYGVGAVKSGFMLAGAQSSSDTADTYVLDNAAGALPTAYNKRADDNPLLAPTATAYQGNFYVLAASSVAPYRIFSATAVETVPQPGDTLPTPVEPVDPIDPAEPTTPVEPVEPESGSIPTALASTGDPLTCTLAFLVVNVLVAGAIATRTASRTRHHS